MSTKAQSKLTSFKMSPSQVSAALDKMVHTGRSIFLWGPPGVSKSAVSQQFATKNKVAFIDIRLSQMDPTDLRGIPYPINENNVSGVRWSAPLALPRDLDISTVLETKFAETQTMKFSLVNPKGSNGIHYVQEPIFEIKSLTPNTTAELIESGPDYCTVALYATDNDGVVSKNLSAGAVRVNVTGKAKAVVGLEEFNSAPPSVQAAAYQLILDKRLGEYIVPEGCYLMAMGNRDTDRGVTFKMGSAISNRFVHIEMEHSFIDWQNWAVANYVHPHVVGFLSAFTEKLFQFDPASASRGFPTPRSWEFVSDILNSNEFKGKDDFGILQGLVTGAIGDAVGMEFIAFREIAVDLPDADLILSGKIKKLDVKNDQKTSETQIMYALTTTMLYRLADKAKLLKRENPDKNRVSQMGDKGKEFFNAGDNFIEFMLNNFRAEITLMGVRSSIKIHKLPFELEAMKHFRTVAEKYSSIVLGA
jgi:hypothetical protein